MGLPGCKCLFLLKAPEWPDNSKSRYRGVAWGKVTKSWTPNLEKALQQKTLRSVPQRCGIAPGSMEEIGVMMAIRDELLEPE